MGTSYQEPVKLLQDLKVKIQKSSIVSPTITNKTAERKPMFLSNVDQVLNFDVQTIHFFTPNTDFPPEIVSTKLKQAFSRLLDVYEFLAGRLVMNPEIGRLEIDCNGSGAGFVVASSECTLDDLGDLVYPNPAFAQLVTTQMDILPKDDKPLCVLQVTSFKCGGFVLGISTNHAAFDGISFKQFLQNLASVVADRPLAIEPCNDRKLLIARSPPQVTFSHHELVQLHDLSPPVFEATSEDLDFKIFKLSFEDIEKLKDKAKKAHGEPQSEVRITSFNVVTALIWRCKALSFTNGSEGNNHINQDLERESTILYAVDIRPRLVPPLPQSYVGNAVLTAYAKAKCKELLEGPFSRLVEMIGDGLKRMTNEYARSAIDWGEIYKGFPHGEVLVSSWWKLGFADMDYPWGRPKYSCPVVYHRKDIILLFPDIDKSSKGVNVLVSLPPKEMGKFQALFQEFLGC